MGRMRIVQSKSLLQPDERVEFPRVVVDQVDLGDFTVGRTRAEPGWRWSNDVMEIPPGHDGWVIGDEALITIEWGGLRSFAGNRTGSTGRALATLLFTDVVDSTRLATTMGDVAWRELLSRHYEAARTAFDRFGGQEITTTGDGMLASFDGPAQALGAASRIRAAAQREGFGIRVGVHVGEVELVGDDVRGAAVHEASRIMSAATVDEILVSEITRTLATPAGLAFEPRGVHVLKGLDGEYALFAYVDGSDSVAP
jgi:class 3 adenylate cyclase